MFGKKKHRGLILSVIISISIIFTSCQDSTVDGYEINGETQGTTYSIIIAESDVDVSKHQIDSLFSAFDASLSTYIGNSVISKLNIISGTARISDKSGFFKECYLKSAVVYRRTNGFFDPSVFPLVKGWGFMDNMDTPLSQKEVDSILQFVSFEDGKLHHVEFSGDEIVLTKFHPNFKLDFNAIAQGQSVDVVDEFLRNHGYNNYYIEVGGEIIVRGKNREGDKWRIGVDLPEENLETRELENVLHVTNKAIATSGNYRKFYEKDGVKYSHTLNPKTGFPVTHSLLSATVIADDCAKADAYATAFMVMGVENALKFVVEHPEVNLDIYLLYADENGGISRKMSKGLSQYLSE